MSLPLKSEKALAFKSVGSRTKCSATSNFVTLGKILNLYKLQFPHLCNEENCSIHAQGCSKDEMS